MVRSPLAKRQRISNLQGQISSCRSEMAEDSLIESLQQKLDDIVASECPLTGEGMIDTISQPFIGDEDQAEANEWAL